MHLLQDFADHQARLRPEAIAVVSGPRTIAYGELVVAANRVARALQAAGCGHGDRVAILLPKSIEAIVSILGVLKAGCAYVPLDTVSPLPRLSLVMQSSDAKLVLAANSSRHTYHRLVDQVGQKSIQVGWMDNTEPPDTSVAFRLPDLEHLPAQAPPCGATELSLAHILFTSGSTGRPKGVMITHANVRHYVDWAIQYFSYEAGDRVSGHPPLHFDLSTMDIFCTFASGAELHLVPPQLNVSPHEIAKFIRQHRLTQWFSVPSLLSYMARFDVVSQGDFPDLRRLLWCGERFPTPSLIYWMKRLPHVSFTNLYGPTETTIASSYYRVTEIPKSGEIPIPIGQACEGEQMYVLDQDMKPTRFSEVGDLFIAGVGLSPGYWQDPEKTDAAFIHVNLGAESERLYRTGDLASIESDGMIYLHGRVDSQIKSRGYRIELGEIETALHTTEGVREAAVVGVEVESFYGTTICCAIVPEADVGFQPELFRERLATKLPTYMMPARWLCFDVLPLNDNGKVDRSLLKRKFQDQLQPATSQPL